jgi:hypothetical protein
MRSRRARERARAYVRVASWPLRMLAHVSRLLLVAMATALGAPPPKPVKHEDSVVQVAEDDRPGPRR